MPENDLAEQINRRAEALVVQERDATAFAVRIQNPIPLAHARYQLTQIVIWVFIVCLFAVFVVITAGEKDRAVFLVDVMKTMLLPLVTLMIGHYFGSKGD